MISVSEDRRLQKFWVRLRRLDIRKRTERQFWNVVAGIFLISRKPCKLTNQRQQHRSNAPNFHLCLSTCLLCHHFTRLSITGG